MQHVCKKGRTGAIGHFTVVGLVPQPLREREAEVDIVLIQTFYNANFA